MPLLKSGKNIISWVRVSRKLLRCTGCDKKLMIKEQFPFYLS
jgi:hypothetical protein